MYSTSFSASFNINILYIYTYVTFTRKWWLLLLKSTNRTDIIVVVTFCVCVCLCLLSVCFVTRRAFHRSFFVSSLSLFLFLFWCIYLICAMMPLIHCDFYVMESLDYTCSLWLVSYMQFKSSGIEQFQRNKFNYPKKFPAVYKLRLIDSNRLENRIYDQTYSISHGKFLFVVIGNLHELTSIV